MGNTHELPETTISFLQPDPIPEKPKREKSTFKPIRINIKKVLAEQARLEARIEKRLKKQLKTINGDISNGSRTTSL